MATRPDPVVRNLDLESALDEVTARYTSANPASRAQYERALRQPRMRRVYLGT